MPHVNSMQVVGLYQAPCEQHAGGRVVPCPCEQQAGGRLYHVNSTQVVGFVTQSYLLELSSRYGHDLHGHHGQHFYVYSIKLIKASPGARARGRHSH